MKRKPSDLDRLLREAKRLPAAARDEEMPAGFADRVLRRHPIGRQQDTETVWLAWRRLTTWTAAASTFLAIAVSILPSSARESASDESSEWTRQIEAWVFEP